MNDLARCQVAHLRIGLFVLLAFRITRSDHNRSIFFSSSVANDKQHFFALFDKIQSHYLIDGFYSQTKSKRYKLNDFFQFENRY